MARGIRFLKAERKWMRAWLEPGLKADADVGDERAVKLGESVLRKLDESEAPQGEKVRNYLSVKEALTAFQSVLDRRLILPPNGAGAVFAMMQAKLKSLGLTTAQCDAIAEEAGMQWKGNIKAQSLLNQAEALLQAGQERSAAMGSEPLGGWQGAEPGDPDVIEMEDL